MSDLLVTRDGAIMTITLNRPEKLNAVTDQMVQGLREVRLEVNNDPEIRVVVLTGAGRAFWAGTDITGLDQYPSPWELRFREDYCGEIWQVRKPVIAAINGYALGGGLELALSCDVRIAAATAQLGAPEIKLGWVGGGGQSAFLTYAVGPSRAASLLMTGNPIDGTTANEWGLVSEVVTADALLGRAHELARTIASRAPIAAICAKENIRAAYTMPLEAAVRYERDLQTICFATEDATEGRRAFAEKRPPVFRAR
jgi:enoyl-CoA hydratase/carnithine racemase